MDDDHDARKMRFSILMWIAVSRCLESGVEEGRSEEQGGGGLEMVTRAKDFGIEGGCGMLELGALKIACIYGMLVNLCSWLSVSSWVSFVGSVC